MCVVPSFIGMPMSGNSARDLWVTLGFTGSFNKDTGENNGTILSQSLLPGAALCSSSITVHNHI
jgi:hypothetical protein